MVRVETRSEDVEYQSPERVVEQGKGEREEDGGTESGIRIFRSRFNTDLQYLIPGQIFLPVLLSKYSSFVLYDDV